ncbi:hypothetical protein Ndes2526B_g02887 [Nannochloris sp. 'desiccata']
MQRLISSPSCNCSYQTRIFRKIKPTVLGHTRLNRHPAVVRAGQVPGEPPASSTDDEARLEALEASVRAKKGAKVAAAAAASRQTSASSDSRFAEWKEGQLFPEGWSNMDPLEKMNELYLGQRGFLFWSTKLATNGVIALGVAWVLFRIVGPALGLYQLADDINTPSF